MVNESTRLATNITIKPPLSSKSGRIFLHEHDPEFHKEYGPPRVVPGEISIDSWGILKRYHLSPIPGMAYCVDYIHLYGGFEAEFASNLGARGAMCEAFILLSTERDHSK